MPKKWVLFSFLALILTAVFVMLILQSGMISEKARDYAASAVERLVGRPVHIDEAELRPFSSSVTLKGLKTLSHPDSHSEITAKEIKIYFSPWSLLTQLFFIRQIVIESPTVTVVEKGLSEKPFSFSDSDAPAPAPAVIVRSIRVKDGALFYQGEGAVKALALASVDADIRADLKMTRFDVEFSGGQGHLSMGGIERKIDRLEANFVSLPGEIDLKKAAIASEQMFLEVEGALHPWKDDFFDLRFNSRFPLQEIKAAVAGKTFSGETNLQGRLTGSLREPALTGKISLPRLFVDGVEVGSLASEISYKNEKVFLASLSGEIFSGTYSGEAEGRLAITPVGPETGSQAGVQAAPDPLKRSPDYRVKLVYQDLPLEKIKRVGYGEDGKFDRSLEGILLKGEIVLKTAESGKEGFEGAGKIEAKRRPLLSAPLPADSNRLSRLIALIEEGGVSWRWSGRELALEGGTLHLPETRAIFRGKWGAAEGLHLETAVQSDEIKSLSDSLRFPVTGRFSLSGVLSGKLEDPLFRGAVTVENWTLKKYPFGPLSSRIIYEKGRLTLDGGRWAGSKRAAQSGGYDFNGSIDLKSGKGPQFDLRADASAADPQEILTFFGLSIPLETAASGHLWIKGTPSGFSVKGPLTLGKGSLYGEHFDRGSLELTVTEGEVLLRKVLLEREKLRAEGEGEIQYAGTYLLNLKARGLPLQQIKQVKSMLPHISGETALEASGKGSFKKPQLKIIAAVRQLRYAEMEAGMGTIRADWDEDRIRFTGSFPEKSLAVKGDVLLTGRYPFSIQSRFEQLRIDPFFKERLSGPLSKMSLILTGRIEGKGNLAQIEQASLSASFSELLADFSGYPVKNDGPIAFRAAKGDFTLETARLKGVNTALEFNGSFTLFQAWNLFLRGEADLNLIKFFTKEIDTAKGKAHLSLRITDRWAEPRILGELNLQDGAIRTARLAQPIRISSMTAVFNEHNLVLEVLEGEVGRGRFHANGKAALAGFGIGAFGFLLELSNAQVNLLPDLPGTVDGELLFQRNEGAPSLKGDLVIKKAVYQKRVETNLLMFETTKKREPVSPSGAPLFGATRMNVHLYGKDNIWINNNVAKIPLEMDLVIRGTLDQPVVIGRVAASHGEIFFKRNTFQVASASVEFLNPDKIEPIFNVQARTTVKANTRFERYDIALSLIGTLSQFDLTLTSSPALAETDILALLTVGKTYQEIAQSQTGGGSEATSFVVSQLIEEGVTKIPVIDQIVDRIQVDPYTSGTKASSGTRLTAEKRLLDNRLVVIYSKTPDPSEEDLIRMIYEVNKHISLEGKRDENGQIGGDIRFRFEFR